MSRGKRKGTPQRTIDESINDWAAPIDPTLPPDANVSAKRALKRTRLRVSARMTSFGERQLRLTRE